MVDSEFYYKLQFMSYLDVSDFGRFTPSYITFRFNIIENLNQIETKKIQILAI